MCVCVCLCNQYFVRKSISNDKPKISEDVNDEYEIRAANTYGDLGEEKHGEAGSRRTISRKNISKTDSLKACVFKSNLYQED